MSRLYSQIPIALFAGAILAIMIKLNAGLANISSPLEASWIAHGLGAVTALGLLSLFSYKPKTDSKKLTKHAPWFTYLGGLPGAFTVILAGITVNSPLGLAGSLALALLGQVLFSLIVDYFGLFGSFKKTLGVNDIKVIGLILTGCLFIIFARVL
ncbi:hypothetical protein MED121_08788 [Marinomonas sp. MED121]|uniref:DMT family transporter n=1 Tax=Marinomonas sp. MED121 TaxID=314277 RepID=UPI00006900C0|nr:DMT family transporter [Marinomonas sp. MED121]EAQ65648.1 hypothetical protein MED121_08788 [Marinomonas sp. MED121]